MARNKGPSSTFISSPAREARSTLTGGGGGGAVGGGGGKPSLDSGGLMEEGRYGVEKFSLSLACERTD